MLPVIVLILLFLSTDTASQPEPVEKTQFIEHCFNRCYNRWYQCRDTVKERVPQQGNECLQIHNVNVCIEHYRRGLDLCNNRGDLCKVNCQFIFQSGR